MKKEEFSKLLKQYLESININIEDNQISKFFNYMEFLLEWNKKINLTAIVEHKDIILKHFVDSLTILKYIKEKDTIVDIGTGAGFPGIPIKIMNKNNNITLVDSLNKRLIFIKEIINQLKLQKIETYHSRAEDFGQNLKNRERYNVSIARAVAPLRVLAEYMLPVTKVDGICICMKGNNVEEEIEESKKTIDLLGGQIQTIEEIILPNSDIKRNIIIIKKIKETSKQYPRRAGTPSKTPL